MSGTELFSPDEFAERDPDATAVVNASTGERISYRTMVDRSKQVANLLHERGLRPGDHVALLMTNVPEYFEIVWGAHRGGYLYTAVNWHLSADEVRYVLEDSGAQAVFVSADLIDVAETATNGLPGLGSRVLIGADQAGWERYDEIVPSRGTAPLGAELEGKAMLYSSGTTGRPKGILHGPVEIDRAFGDVRDDVLWVNRYGLDESSVALACGPLYHGAPLISAMRTHRHGGAVVLTARFDAEQVLDAIERYRVTHIQAVPTMFVRLLRLPVDVRARYDVSSLIAVAHGAAPCPVDVKRQILDWFGPVVHEYYSATEAAGFVSIGPEEWLAHPGSVGRVAPGSVAITDDDGTVLPAGADGIVWFTNPTHRFTYHDDPAKSAEMYNEHGWARMGDLGHLDDEGYLFLTGRSNHTIISGGVNIYPQEVEDLLIGHPAIDDVAVIGVPDAEFGESVKAVVTVRDGYVASSALAEEIIGWARDHIAHYKCPRTVTFVESLPRSAAGKMMKHRLIEQLADHPHIASRGSVVTRAGGSVESAPAPRFSDTPLAPRRAEPGHLGVLAEVLDQWKTAPSNALEHL